MKRFNRNALDSNMSLSTNDQPTEQSILPSIYLNASRINHSCSPNAVRGYTVDKHVIVQAIKYIGAGEEITIDYLISTAGPPEWRRYVISEAFKFVCKCNSCLSSATITAQEGQRKLNNQMTFNLGSSVLLERPTPEEIEKSNGVLVWFDDLRRQFEILKDEYRIRAEQNAWSMTHRIECVKLFLFAWRHTLEVENIFGISQDVIDKSIQRLAIRMNKAGNPRVTIVEISDSRIRDIMEIDG